MRVSVIRGTARSALLRAAAIAAAAVALAACTGSNGGGGSASSTAAPAPSAASVHRGSSPTASSASPTSSGSSTPAAPSLSSMSPSANGSGTPRCTASALKGEVKVSAAGGAAGSIYYPLDLTNTSDTTCTLFGYPGVSFVTGPDGTQLGAAALRNPVAAATTVTLGPGQVAHAVLQVGAAGNYDPAQCQPVTAHYLRIYPPDQTASLVVPFTTQVCSAALPASIGTQLGVTVVQPGAG